METIAVITLSVEYPNQLRQHWLQSTVAQIKEEEQKGGRRGAKNVVMTTTRE